MSRTQLLHFAKWSCSNDFERSLCFPCDWYSNTIPIQYSCCLIHIEQTINHNTILKEAAYYFNSAILIWPQRINLLSEICDWEAVKITLNLLLRKPLWESPFDRCCEHRMNNTNKHSSSQSMSNTPDLICTSRFVVHKFISQSLTNCQHYRVLLSSTMKRATLLIALFN